MICLMSGCAVRTTDGSDDLGYNDVGTVGTDALSGALRKNASLACLGLGSNLAGARGGAVLAAALRSNHALTSLDLSNNAMGASCTEALRALLRDSCTLATILGLGLS